jgi:hypothetical protein
MLRIAERLEDSSRLVAAHQALGAVLYFRGKIVLADRHFRLSLAKFDSDSHKFPDWPGSHPAIQCEFYLALISWILGYPDRALEEAHSAVKSAEALGHPFTLGQTLCYTALIPILRHELSASRTMRLGPCKFARSGASRTTLRPPFASTAGRSVRPAKRKKDWLRSHKA